MKELLNTPIVKIFKIIDEEKRKLKTKQDVLEFIEKILPFFNISEKYANFIFKLYILNFRENGDYSGLKKENILDPKNFPIEKISNQGSYIYTSAKLPFQGSNLSAEWKKDTENEDYYEVTSYKWYPIYIYKNGIWFKNSKSYSQTTSKQMYKSNPERETLYDSNLKQKVILATPEEMLILRKQGEYDEIVKNRLKNISKIAKDLISKRVQILNIYANRNLLIKIKYKIKNVEVNDQGAEVFIDIIDIKKYDLNSENGLGLPLDDYFINQNNEINLETIEKKIKEKEYYKTFRDLDTGNIKFSFNYLKK